MQHGRGTKSRVLKAALEVSPPLCQALPRNPETQWMRKVTSPSHGSVSKGCRQTADSYYSSLTQTLAAPSGRASLWEEEGRDFLGRTMAQKQPSQEVHGQRVGTWKINPTEPPQAGSLSPTKEGQEGGSSELDRMGPVSCRRVLNGTQISKNEGIHLGYTCPTL